MPKTQVEYLVESIANLYVQLSHTLAQNELLREQNAVLAKKLEEALSGYDNIPPRQFNWHSDPGSLKSPESADNPNSTREVS